MDYSSGSSDLSPIPSEDSLASRSTDDYDLGWGSRPSVDTHHADTHSDVPPPAKRRKVGMASLSALERVPSLPPVDDDAVSLSSDSWSSGPGSPAHGEYALRDEATTRCLWRDCTFGDAANNDELVNHVQTAHCGTGAPKKSKYVCEWGECQRKSSFHPSGYALKAHMRSHTKEKPYYCVLPECDKSFTRSDALAKHMRTVHEPEPIKLSNHNDAVPPGKKPIKLKLSNGSAASKAIDAFPTPTHDEDGNPVAPSPANDNIAYIPAHHPVTGQPGFMITYPPDINFTDWESTIAADQLMRLLRRQIHWAQAEGQQLKRECDELERQRKEEWEYKEILLEGVLEAELSKAEREGLLNKVDAKARALMQSDVQPSGKFPWTKGTPSWRTKARSHVVDVDMANANTPYRAASTELTPSPPPTGKSGGFDGDADPYDNYLAGRMAEYEAMQRARSLQNTPQKGVAVAEPPED